MYPQLNEWKKDWGRLEAIGEIQDGYPTTIRV